MKSVLGKEESFPVMTGVRHWSFFFVWKENSRGDK